MKKILSTLFIGIFLISFISSFSDAELPQICGGDSELLIGCLGDEELVFLAGEVPTEYREGLRLPIEVEEEIPTEEPKIPLFLFTIVSFLGISGEDIIFFEAIMIFFLLLILFIFIKRRKKKEEEEKKKKESQPKHL